MGAVFIDNVIVGCWYRWGSDRIKLIDTGKTLDYIYIVYRLEDDPSLLEDGPPLLFYQEKIDECEATFILDPGPSEVYW